VFTQGAEEGISRTIRITKSATGHGPLALTPGRAHSLLETDLVRQNVPCHRKHLIVTIQKYKLINSVEAKDYVKLKVLTAVLVKI
jgi:hypothetical protein